MKMIDPDVFLSRGLVTQNDIREAIQESLETGSSVPYVLVSRRKVSEGVFFELLNDQCAIPYVVLKRRKIKKDVAATIPLDIAMKYNMIAFDMKDNTLQIAMADPFNKNAQDTLVKNVFHAIKIFVSSTAEIQSAIADSYYSEDQAEESLEDEMSMEQIEFLSKTRVESYLFKDQSEPDESDTGKLLNMILNKALETKASDIHIDPKKHEVHVRFRIDGTLYKMFTVELDRQKELVNKIKVMSNMVVFEHRLPQDGKMSFEGEEGSVNIRVATYPVANGEKVALRFLRKGSEGSDLKGFGFEDEDFDKYSRLLQRPNGIILVVGPTGSGKTTTIYSSLEKLNAEDKHIVTVEDPVEYEIDGVNHSQIKPAIGYTYAAALKTILRIDPDVILVGEMRDFETAEIALRASLTGRLVFSTLHTANTVQAYTRLLDMGIPPYLLPPTIIGIIAQRLAKRLCPHCKEAYSPGEPTLENLGIEYDLDTMSFYKAVGCEKCVDIGYIGRTGVYEVLVPDGEINDLVLQKQGSEKIFAVAKQHGLSTLRENGLKKATRGETTIDEVLRIIT